MNVYVLDAMDGEEVYHNGVYGDLESAREKGEEIINQGTKALYIMELKLTSTGKHYAEFTKVNEWKLCQ